MVMRRSRRLSRSTAELLASTLALVLAVAIKMAISVAVDGQVWGEAEVAGGRAAVLMHVAYGAVFVIAMYIFLRELIRIGLRISPDAPPQTPDSSMDGDPVG